MAINIPTLSAAFLALTRPAQRSMRRRLEIFARTTGLVFARPIPVLHRNGYRPAVSTPSDFQSELNPSHWAVRIKCGGPTPESSYGDAFIGLQRSPLTPGAGNSGMFTTPIHRAALGQASQVVRMLDV